MGKLGSQGVREQGTSRWGRDGSRGATRGTSSGGRWCRRAGGRSLWTSRSSRRGRPGCCCARCCMSSLRARCRCDAPPCCCTCCAPAGRRPLCARSCSCKSMSTAPRRGAGAPGRGPPPRSDAASATTPPYSHRRSHLAARPRTDPTRPTSLL